MSFHYDNNSSSSSGSEYEKEQQEIDEIIFSIPQAVGDFLDEDSPPRRDGERHPKGSRVWYNQLYNDYFADNPVYPANIFRRRFRMRREVFLRIVRAVESYDPFFQRRSDATGRLSISALQKCTAAMRMLAYGIGADVVDEYLKLSESLARMSLKHFCEAVVALFEKEYMRRPNEHDLSRLLIKGEQRGFPGMLGSIDCMHWEWKNCPTSWKGLYQGRSGKATIVLEAVASYDLWIWHSYFGTPGSNNDLNVLHTSPVFNDILDGVAPRVNYSVNGTRYEMGYYLTDGIYPKWASFIQSIQLPQTPKHKLFAERQEAARKDVERAFGVLQSRFAIVRRPALSWDRFAIHSIMMACIIMHNMIVEDERDSVPNYDDPSEFNEDVAQHASSSRQRTYQHDPFQYSTERIWDISRFLTARASIENASTHCSLKSNLVENIWQRFGDSYE